MRGWKYYKSTITKHHQQRHLFAEQGIGFSRINTLASTVVVMTTESDLLQNLYAAYNLHDATAASLLYATDGQHVDVAAGNPKIGGKTIAEGLEAFFAAFPDAHWTVESTADTGDGRAFGRYMLTGTLQQDMWSFTARGQKLELAGVHVLEYLEGRITKSEDYWDAATFSRQMNRS